MTLKRFTLIVGKLDNIVEKLKAHPRIGFIVEVINRYFEDGVGRAAAEFAYYMFFSLFPMLIFINAVIGTLKFDITGIMNELNLVLPDQITQFIVDYFSYVSSFEAKTMIYAGVVLATWSIARSVSSLLRSVNKGYRMEVPGILSTALSVVIAMLLMFSVFALLIVMMVSKNLLTRGLEFLGLSTGLASIWQLIQFLIGPVYICALLSGFYYISTKRRYRFKQAIPGAIFACLGWLGISVAFSFYVNNVYGYSALYGSLSTIMILMLWLYMTGIIMILGGHLNHVLIVRNKNRRGGKG